MNKRAATAFNTHTIAFLALLTAACVVGRMMFQFIPNVQPMTAILLLIAYFLGIRDGIIVSLMSVVITNLFMGMGFWTVTQLISYTVIMIVFYLLLKIPPVAEHLTLQAILAGAMGFLYGFIISVLSAYLFQMPSIIAYWLQGLSFDALHAAGNVGFYVILYPILKVLFGKAKARYQL